METVAALSAYILDQTELLNEKVSKESSGNFVKAQKTDDESIKNKEKVKLNPDQIHIKNLTIDDCGVKDADFATLLDALLSQGKLKSITYINNEFSEQSV